MTTGVRRYRRSIVCAVFGMAAWLAVEPVAPSPASAADAHTSSADTIAPQTRSEEGRRRSNPGGAVAGFALLGGWLLLGYGLFRQGRRRLARMADDRDPRRQSGDETTRHAPGAPRDERRESPMRGRRGEEQPGTGLG